MPVIYRLTRTTPGLEPFVSYFNSREHIKQSLTITYSRRNVTILQEGNVITVTWESEPGNFDNDTWKVEPTELALLVYDRPTHL